LEHDRGRPRRRLSNAMAAEGVEEQGSEDVGHRRAAGGEKRGCHIQPDVER